MMHPTMKPTWIGVLPFQEMYEYNHTDADFIENIYFPIIKVITTNATDVIENNDDPIYKTGNITVRDNKEVKDFFYLHLSHLSSKITQQNTHILILFFRNFISCFSFDEFL